MDGRDKPGHDGYVAGLALQVRTLSLVSAVLPALLDHPVKGARSVLRAVLRGPRNIVRHLRPDLAQLAQAPTDRASYTLWTELFDQWSEPEIHRLLQSGNRPDWPDIDCFVFHGGRRMAALNATLAALAASPLRSRRVIIGPSLGFANAVAASRSDYVALIQAGEVLPRHALPLLADQAAALGWPDILYADEDRLTARRRRHDPVFKPEASRTLMLSGTLTTGVWLVRRRLLAGVPAHATGWAETVRLDVWLRLQECGRADNGRRLPFVLTHRRPDAEKTPAEALARVAREHIARTALPAHVEPATPLRLRMAVPRAQQAKVGIVIPSGCRLPHVRHCISGLLARTDYADFEVLIVLTGRVPLDSRQSAILAHLRTDPRVQTLILDQPAFNYARANNEAVRRLRAPYVCLLNDDVIPLTPDWLAAMVGHLADPDIGVVGARLLYPDRSVQHAGIILRPDGTGEHAHRLLPRDAVGYAHRSVLSQEVSAVTGACLLTRRSLYHQLGGLDESFASAFNDVDFCLRARAAGQGVVVAAEAELIHYESLSYGRHYTPAEGARAAADRARVLARWGARCAEDPFYNPNLSRQAGGLWEPAFPPRVERVASVTARNRAA